MVRDEAVLCGVLESSYCWGVVVIVQSGVCAWGLDWVKWRRDAVMDMELGEIRKKFNGATVYRGIY